MTTINIFTENIFSDWKLDEKDVIEKTRRMLEFYISKLKKDYFDLKKKYLSEIKKCLDENGLEIPFPQRVLHIVHDPEK
jgi:small-conductance mechanosensitive channel